MVLFRFRRSDRSPSGANIPESQAAEPQSLSGYEASLLVDVVFAKTQALRPEDIASQTGAERTMLSVLLAERVTRSNPLRVLDFGGACGFHHMAAAMIGVPLRWAVVESPAMVEKAGVLSTDSLRFFPGIGDAASWLGGVDLMFSSSALQYMDEPGETLRALVGLRAPLVVWSRLPMTDGEAWRETQTSRLGENGPGPLPPGFEDRDVRYVRTHLAQPAFMAAHEGYKLLQRSGDPTCAGFIFLRANLAL